MAALIFIGLALGVWATLLPRGASRSEMLFFHKSIGVTVFGLVALRIIWRLVAGAPDYAEPLGRLTHAGSRAAHIALYALMIAMPVSGYLSSTAAARRFPWFGLFSLPRLVAQEQISRGSDRPGPTLYSPGRSRSCSPRISARSSGTRR